jgi:hypothetical protein
MKHAQRKKHTNTLLWYGKLKTQDHLDNHPGIHIHTRIILYSASVGKAKNFGSLDRRLLNDFEFDCDHCH